MWQLQVVVFGKRYLYARSCNRTLYSRSVLCFFRNVGHQFIPGGEVLIDEAVEPWRGLLCGMFWCLHLQIRRALCLS